MFTLKTFPVKTIPDAPLVLSAPLNVVVPVPDVCVIDEAVIAAVVQLVVLVIVKAPRGAMPPAAPVNVMLPVPAASDRAWVPSSVLLKLMFALFEVIVLVPVKSTGLENVKGFAPETVILAPI